MKRFFLTPLAIAVIAVSAVGCKDTKSLLGTTETVNSTKFDLAAVRKIVDENNSRFTKAHVTGDASVIDNMFTADAKCLPPESEPVIGRAAIAKLTAQYIAFGITEFREETSDFYGNADLIVDQGDYVMVYGKEKTMEKGKYVNVWKKEDGVWRIYSNIWNSNAAPAPAK